MNVPLRLPLRKIDGREWIELIDSEGKSVAEVTTFDQPDQKAEFIRRTVSVHEELLKALEAYTNSEYAKSRLDGTLLSANFAQAMAALAKAGEA
ncbi:hypothetical protein [Collimonas humicola]|uniref:hypothetical protein n=1 Tax=Collimonas humicola TaxID=2825886 RepID=UPI001B8B6F41|nr:hypothetical protein [Collimonas humicola]